jgi:hypothetical protein
MKVKNIKLHKKTLRIFLSTLVSLTCFVNIAFAQQQLGGPPYGGPGGGGQTGGPGGGGQTAGGQWKVQYIKNGYLNTPSGSAPWQTRIQLTPTSPFVITDFPMGGYILLTPASPPNPSSSMSSSGTVTAKYSWVNPDGTPAPNPPNHIYILEDSVANWSKPATFLGSGSASNGFAPEITFLGGGQSSGKRMKRLAVSNGTAEYTSPQLSASVNAQNPFSNIAGGIGAGVSFAATLSPHSVLIECDLMEEGGNWRKGSNGPVQNMRNVDGSITVDSAVSTDSGIITVRPFVAVPTGFPHTWPFDYLVGKSWSMTETGFLINTNGWETELRLVPVKDPFSTIENWDPTGKTTTVKFKVTDFQHDLSIEENADYKIRWHREVENWHTIGATKPFIHLITASFDLPTTQNGNINFTWYDEDVNIMSYANWEAIGIVVGGGGDAITSHSHGGFGGLYSSLLGYLGVLIGQTQPKANSGSIGAKTLWDNQYSTPVGRTNTQFEDGLWSLAGVNIRVRYEVTPHEADTYVVNGYSGVTKIAVEKKLPNLPIVCGDFILDSPDI